MANEEKDDFQPRSYPYSRWKLYASAFIATSIFISVGIFLGWPSPALVLLQPRNYTSLETSLLASFPCLAPGPLITMFGINQIGRKNTIIVIWALLMTSWSTMYFSDHINVLLAARYIGGWGMSAAFSTIGIYISELADVSVRGALNSTTMIFYSLGNIIVCSVGPFTSINVITLTAIAITASSALFFWFIPETPYYQVYKGQNDEALATLQWLRVNANKKDIEDELSKIQYNIEEEKKDKVGFRKLFTSKVVFKQFGIAWYILFIQQLSGLDPLSAYSQTIFQSANLKFNAAFIPIALNTFALIVGIPAPFLVKKFGNRVLFIGSTLGCSMAHGILAAYFLLLEGGYNVSFITWLPIFGTFFLLLSIFIGLAGLIWAVVSDLFAPSVKGYANGICGIYATALGFVGVTAFGLSKDYFNFGLTFLGYSIALLISTIGLLFVPDVTRMPLHEIQDYFEGKSKTSKKV